MCADHKQVYNLGTLTAPHPSMQLTYCMDGAHVGQLEESMPDDDGTADLQ